MSQTGSAVSEQAGFVSVLIGEARDDKNDRKQGATNASTNVVVLRDQVE